MIKACPEWYRLSAEQQEAILKYHETSPVKIGAIAKEFGLTVKRSTLKPGISGSIREDGSEVVIKINRHDSEQRQRFTLAHEIAHFLLHRDKIGDGIEDTMLFRSALSNDLEAEANRLAADIVMPFSLIKKLALPSSMRFEERVEETSKMLNISIPAIEIRLGKKGF